MSRRKPQPEAFDVVEFLRESDDDLKSALNSLLRSSADPSAAEADVKTAAPVISESPTILDPPPELTPEFTPLEAEPDRNPSPELNANPEPVADPAPITISGLNLAATAFPNPGITLRTPPAPIPPPPIIRTAAANLGPGRRFPIREMRIPEEAHSRAEQQVYDLLWRNAEPLDEVSRTITIGFGAMAKLVRLSESNARINVRSLIAKLAIEESSGYNCEQSVGRTYRILDGDEIMRRRREAGLTWYMRRTLAVVFVDATGQPIDLGVKRPRAKRPALTTIPGINLADPVSTVLSRYGEVDTDTVARLRSATARICPDFRDEELVYFIQVKGDMLARRTEFGGSAIAFLLTAVPRCFAGEELRNLRENDRQQREELLRWYREQRSILDDPNASEEDRKWAEKALVSANLPVDFG